MNTIQSFRLYSIPSRIPSLPYSLRQLTSQTSQTSQSNQEISCQLCGVDFRTNLDLRKHLLSDLLHTKVSIEQAVRSNSLSTNSDSIDFPLTASAENPRNVKSIKSEKESGFRCIICCKTFISYKGMKQHMGKKHNIKNKQSKCEVCEKLFVDKHALKLHVKQVHEQSTRAVCPNCNQIFYNKYTMARHMEKRHA